MKLFYIRHHFQSIVRSTSFGGEILAFFILTVLIGSSLFVFSEKAEGYLILISEFFSQYGENHGLVLLMYVFIDLTIRLVFKRPFPKLKYYVLWNANSSLISIQYLFTSLVGFVPYILFLNLLMMITKANAWLGIAGALVICIWWLANYFVGLISQFSNPIFRSILLSSIVLVILFQYLFPQVDLVSFFMNPITPVIVFISGLIMSYTLIKRTIDSRRINEKEGIKYFDLVPFLSFKNPVFQLEWALIARNKRTRSNLLMGVISVIVLPFLIDEDSTPFLTTFIFFIATAFFIIQHGVYSLGWEGSYFDFLLVNVSPEKFIKTRYLFYVGTCVVGFFIALIPTVISGLSLLDLFMVLLFSIGIIIPFVLYRSTFIDTKIVLSENSFMNYNGMMTGPVMVTSFLVMMLPFLMHGISQIVLEDQAFYGSGLLGLIGLSLFNPITNVIAERFHTRKYHLSQSFKR